jgi:two-component system, sensor histidine kinase and response regulator
LTCLVVGGQAGLAGDLATYLTAEMASVARVSDLAAAREWIRMKPPGPAVWVVDASDEVSGLGELQLAIRGRKEGDLRVVVVLLGRGQSRPRADGDGIFIIDGNALHRRTLAKAVAVAAGRASAEPEELSDCYKTAKVPLTREKARQQHRLILVAEDNEINQKVIGQQMCLLGYVADVASTGTEAFKRWQSGDYALLLTDLHMPEMDGYDLTMQIRTAEAGRSRTPIIALTANALRGESERCLAIGMDGYLCKPAPLAALASALEKWLPAANTTHAMTSSKSVPLEVSALEALIGTEPSVIQEFLREFGESAGRSGVELAEACAAQRPEKAASIAHRLKSSARSVGALRLGEFCAAIEVAGTAGDMAALAGLLPALERELAAVDDYLHALRAGDDPVEGCA